MIVIKRDNPQIFGGKPYLMTKQETKAVNTIADAISINRSPLVKLLQQHDIQASMDDTHEQLLGTLTNAFNKKQFALDFEKLYKKGYNNFGDDDVEGSSDISNNSDNSFWAGSGDNVNNPGGNTNYSYSNNSGTTSGSNNSSGGGGGGWLGAIGGILGGIGAIGQLFSKPDTVGAQLNYNQQILALAQQKEAARKRNQTIAIIAVAGLILGTAGFLIYYAKKNKAL